MTRRGSLWATGSILAWLLVDPVLGGRAWAATTCANPTINTVQFGNIDLSTGTVSVTGSVSWSCTATGVLSSPRSNVTMCLNLSTGTGGTQADPRLMGNGTSTLQYQLYTDAADTQIWGSTGTPATPTPLTISVNIPAGAQSSTTVTGETPFYARLPAGQTTATVGTYNSTLAVTVVGAYNTNAASTPKSCTSGPSTLNPGSASFLATANVQKSCLVTANTLNLGTVPATAVNSTASSTLSVTCSNTMPYFVGLSPSNGSSTGAGLMSGSLPSNTSKVPYQLSSTPGPNGTVWGNTATSTNAGNGVGGAGTGLAQSLTVYATAPSANFLPDTYSDTVTVNVNY